MEILDEFYTPSRMRLCSGNGLNCCIRDRNRVCTCFWHTVDNYLSGVWWCFNLLKRNLHSCWGVNSVFCGSQPAGHHQMPSAFVIVTRFKTRSTIPLSTCAERCGFHSAGFVSLNALKHPSVFKSISSVISVLSQLLPRHPDAKCAHVGMRDKSCGCLLLELNQSNWISEFNLLEVNSIHQRANRGGIYLSVMLFWEGWGNESVVCFLCACTCWHVIKSQLCSWIKSSQFKLSRRVLTLCW